MPPKSVGETQSGTTLGSRSSLILLQNGRNSMETASSEVVLLPFPDGKWLSEPYSVLTEISSGLEPSDQPT